MTIFETGPMLHLGTSSEAHKKVWEDAQRLLAHIKVLSSTSIPSAGHGMSVLRKLREETYEDLNQIQHEYLVLVALDWLTVRRDYDPRTEWFWNPRQTGDSSEPDLRGIVNGEPAISAEITTSKEPNGVIDARIRTTLAKLDKMNGQRFYFVRSDTMAARARTKILKAGWGIEVVRLSD